MARSSKGGKNSPADRENPPLGGTRRALDRTHEMGGGPPGSGAGPRHAAGDIGSEDEEYEGADTNQAVGEAPRLDDEDPLEQGPPFAGHSGGAVGGSPAERRSEGGHIRGGIRPGGYHHGDSTVGSNPTADEEE